MKTILMFFAFSTSTLVAANFELKLSVLEVRIPYDLKVREEDKLQGYDEFNLELYLYVTNISGKTISFARGYNSYAIEMKNKDAQITLVLKEDSNPMGIEVKMSPAELGVVELNPGETTLVKFREHCLVPKSQPNLKVKYIISEKVGKRYSIWNGQLIDQSHY